MCTWGFSFTRSFLLQEPLYLRIFLESKDSLIASFFMGMGCWAEYTDYDDNYDLNFSWTLYSEKCFGPNKLATGSEWFEWLSISNMSIFWDIRDCEFYNLGFVCISFIYSFLWVFPSLNNWCCLSPIKWSI